MRRTQLDCSRATSNILEAVIEECVIPGLIDTLILEAPKPPTVMALQYYQLENQT
jgi:hypothetical protein